jgi:hypothetical protein
MAGLARPLGVLSLPKAEAAGLLAGPAAHPGGTPD